MLTAEERERLTEIGSGRTVLHRLPDDQWLVDGVEPSVRIAFMLDGFTRDGLIGPVDDSRRQRFSVTAEGLAVAR